MKRLWACCTMSVLILFSVVGWAKASVRNLPFMDPAVPTSERVHDLVGRLTLDEKVRQLSNGAPAIKRLGIPKYNWWNEALHGVASAGLATVFPQPIGLAASWDRELMADVATAISDEARAKFHDFQRRGQRDIYKGLTFFAPNINIFRDPRWGRGHETYGEDPYLTTELAIPFIEELQGHDPRYFKLIATPKHFAAHSGPEDIRLHFDALVSAKDLEETYLPAFKASVQRAHAYSIMSSYNRINGVPATANPWLLDDVLRKSWGFTGYVVSDCDAVTYIFSEHHLVRSLEEAAALSLRGGVDLNCGEAFPSLREALNQGLITEKDVDRALYRLITARFLLGMFDPPEKVAFAQIPYSVVDNPKHRKLALRAAQESIVLLRNQTGLLPLDLNKIHKIAVIGSNADDRSALLGNYSGTPSYMVTPLAGIKKQVAAGTQVFYSRAKTAVERKSAVELARKSDVTIAVLGLTPKVENEGVDRKWIELPADQEKLLKEIQQTGAPVVLVLLNGGSLAIPWADQHIGAILEAWYPGQEGGTALARVLFGAFNPSGRMPVTTYRSTADLPAFTDYSMANRTYRFFKGQPLYRFGDGISYTQFRYHMISPQLQKVKSGDEVEIAVEVSNTGAREGDEITELFVRLKGRDAENETSSLQGFQRTHLKTGEKRQLRFTLKPEQFSAVEVDGRREIKPGKYLIEVGGRLADDRGVRYEVELSAK